MSITGQIKALDSRMADTVFISATVDELKSLVNLAEAAEARAAQLQAERDALAAQLATVTAERDELKRKYDRACNYDFLNEALNSGDGVYRP